MGKPFVILALPRTGTKMLVSVLNSHPELSVRHEFRGTEQEFWENPQVHSNSLKPWMLDERITRIHVYREDAIAGAISLLLMSYRFPDGAFEIPEHEVTRLALFRRQQDTQFREVATMSIAYESLGDVVEFPEQAGRAICDCLSISYEPMRTDVVKSLKLIPANFEELSWLVA